MKGYQTQQQQMKISIRWKSEKKQKKTRCYERQKPRYEVS